MKLSGEEVHKHMKSAINQVSADRLEFCIGVSLPTNTETPQIVVSELKRCVHSESTIRIVWLPAIIGYVPEHVI